MKSINSLLLFLMIVLMIACISREKKPLILLLQQFEEKVDENVLLKFKQAPENSSFYFIEDNLGHIYQDTNYYNTLEKYILDTGIPIFKKEKELFFSFCLYSYLKNKKIEFPTIEKNILEFKEYNKIKEKKELLQIIKTNNNRWNIGDTLNIILPVDISYPSKSTYYNKYPHTLDYSFADDTLKLTGILLNKKYEYYPETNTINPMTLMFDLSITSLSDTNCRILTIKYEIGDIFELPLEVYGRNID